MLFRDTCIAFLPTMYLFQRFLLRRLTIPYPFVVGSISTEDFIGRHPDLPSNPRHSGHLHKRRRPGGEHILPDLAPHVISRFSPSSSNPMVDKVLSKLVPGAVPILPWISHLRLICPSPKITVKLTLFSRYFFLIRFYDGVRVPTTVERNRSSAAVCNFFPLSVLFSFFCILLTGSIPEGSTVS